MTTLDGRRYIVTGSTKGIGLAVAHRLLGSGASVVVNGRDAAVLDEAVQQLGGERVVAVPGSVDDDDVLQACVAAAYDELGGLDGIVNNVGINAFHGPLVEVPRGRWDRTLAVNLSAPLFLVQHAVRRGFRAGSVVNISSVGARRPQHDIGPYCVSKAGLEGLTMALALELGPMRIRVNAVAPGLIATETSRLLWEGEGRRERLAAARPLGRLGEVEDVAAAVAFLLSDESDWVTGAVLTVDGGALVVSGTSGAG
jgi:NAD(P)-dependent dehydrogenase (short-subunit alcohol dehydrogenase family)